MLGRGREVKTPTQQNADIARFKTPTLRSRRIASVASYNSAQTPHRLRRNSPNCGITIQGGRPAEPLTPLAMMPLTLSNQERLDLVTFMQTLTGAPEGEARPTLQVVR